MNDRRIEKDYLLLVKLLKESSVPLTFIDLSGQFNDEPYHYHYSFYNSNKHSLSSGLSFKNPQSAMIKNLHEAIERLTLYGILSPQITTNPTRYPQIELKSYINPNLKKKMRKFNVCAVRRAHDSEIFSAPQDLLFFPNRPSQFTNTSCGTSGGFNKERASLKSISELLEYDALLLWYFGIFNGKKITLSKVKNLDIQKILFEASWYNIEIETIEILNDIGIPIYISFLIDNTGKAPRISCGSGVGLKGLDGLVHSIEEAFQTRIYARYLQYKRFFKPSTNNFDTIDKDKRILFWADQNDLLLLKHRLNSSEKGLPIKEKVLNTDQIVHEYVKKGVYFYFTNLSNKLLDKYGYYVMRYISPNLQSFYLDESHQVINTDRINKLKSNHNISAIKVLPPHPFP